MIKKDRFTNEKLNKLFDSPFSLVNYAIKQAKIKIAKGDVRSSNVAIETLVLLDREGIQPEFTEEIVVTASPTVERKRSEHTNSRKKDPSAYTWSDVK
ncbi:hypothetical protein CpB0122 [Chlamydia pneumoniae TW-183]|uniref:Uncharacterized protein CPn_0121/CP_0652/CPj0121/CpB0122 n=2 Tax=Chlamydia pneumoniae TaxID=83558 RepID=Y121_CHLPN|nr:hypothetical protein [Chlamydia pneumoniae]Q9Z960.1 RecName: Full=Uncharacterized protein CPn_0121/CP_0652/CPj0121/CpB0122 [Chlamydia pneumoniae]AAD18274.1 CT031 hypothetical protein [Chlamydia pneumoniae CWL029]AAF38467.1 conserved hypothetical protein [Chlamydia pneumoniae AR39]AAP98055.1 hypothetical protein CpB0122 [Chlamydia pneumoniae TW-183]ACZ33102.1 conserved hypothetical protein [Chlamydia pneumoniae LPCoLN]ETR80006.1 hypothetical protein X556_0685 [Chlamydia pneumoniae B21]